MSGEIESTKLNNIHAIVLLTCTISGVVALLDANLKVTKIIPTFRNFFETLEPLNLGAVTDFYVCLGPGSFTGIRQTLSFVTGFLTGRQSQGKTLLDAKKPKVHGFSLFDYIRAVEKLPDTTPIFINGFFYKEGIEHLGYIYIPPNTIKFVNLQKDNLPDSVIKNMFRVQNPTHYFTKTYIEDFLKHFSGFTSELTPLYAKPVSITPAKT